MSELLTMGGVTKRFPGVVALSDVQLSLAAGQVLALMGENGAGKSTLMKILGGAYPPDAGEIQIDGRSVKFGAVADAKRAGVALIHQELMPVPNLDIAGNIFGGDQMTEWTVMHRAQRYTFSNPQAGLYDRIAAVRALAMDLPVEGRVVFSARGRFPKGLPRYTLMLASVAAEFPSAERQQAGGRQHLVDRMDFTAHRRIPGGACGWLALSYQRNTRPVPSGTCR